MEDVESTLTKVIDAFVGLQKSVAKPAETHKPTKVFPLILALDSGLKKLKKADKSHPLQELACEIRASFDTKEFRALLLAAFNWRSASQRALKATKQKKAQESALRQKQIELKRIELKQQPKGKSKNYPAHSPGRRPKVGSPISSASRPRKTARTPEQIEKDAENARKFVRDCLAFLNSVPAETIRRLRAPEDYVDLYSAGRRLYGSYGSSQ
jgi:hypothetical protein